MLRFGLVISCCVVSAVAYADPPDGEVPDAEPDCTGELDGHVVDSATHEAVSAATVRIGDRLLGVTDDAGRFVLTNLCFGTTTVVVERPDYVPGERSVVIGGHESIELELVLLGGETIEIKDRAPDPTEMRHATEISGAKLERTRGKSLSAAIADVPGVTELRSATGMAKPIIRGQFGRRLLLLVDGVRHRAQEWGLDHVPEVDPFAADKISVVRGAGGVRYGSDAIGGVVLVAPPELRREPGHNGEVHAIGSSNGRGGTLAARLQSAFDALPGFATQLEGSFKRLASPETPRYPLDNTGALEWNGGVTAGLRRRTSEYKLSYRHYQAELGVCQCLQIDSPEGFYAQAMRGEPLGVENYRADFEIERPKQAVSHDLALARGRWEVEDVGTLSATYAFQHDRRREFDIVRDATTDAQFKFRLMTHEVEGVFNHNPYHLDEHWHLRGTAGVTGLAQIHFYGGLPLVPDHTSFGGGVFASERLVGHDTELELGARYDFLAREASLDRPDFLRLVRSGQLGDDACSPNDGDPVACKSRFHTFTATAGGLRRFGEALTGKLELSAASRAPNTDEQYLNGTAPTFPVFGLGKPDLRPETTYSSSVTLGYQGTRITAEASAFTNLIRDYIYFAPAIGDDGMPIFDVLIRGAFPRFTTQTVDALFYGADGGIAVKPHAALELGGQFSIVRAETLRDGKYLVFVPPDRARFSATYHPPETDSIRKSFISAVGTYVARQKRFDLAADLVAPPPSYFTLGAELGFETCLGDQTARFALQGSNLTNARYRDYTSLLRYFADEPGWQLWLRMSVFFDSTKKGS